MSTLWPLHLCSLTSKSIVFWRSPDFDPLSISQISIMSSFIHCRQVTCGQTESSRPDVSKGVSQSSVSAGCVCGDGVNCVFFILRLTRSTVSWRALSWAKPVRKPSIFTTTTVSQVPPGRVCMCAIFECYVWKLIWGMCVFAFSVGVCVWGGDFYRWVGVCECFCLHLYVITSACEDTTVVSPMCFMYFRGVV